MTEAIAATKGAETRSGAGHPRRRKDKPLRAYLLLAILIFLGFSMREQQLITPESGIGYWLGIAGGSAMLILLLYPVRKRVRILHKLGATRHWFQMHMALGLVGPLLVLYHSNFTLGSFNSRVAMYCMLLVAGSGIVGRHFYAAIHRGLYGQKTSLQELQAELALAVEKSHSMTRFMPGLVARLEELATGLQGNDLRQTMGVGRSIRWTFTHRFTQLSLLLAARRELRLAAKEHETVAHNYTGIYRAARRYIRDYINITGRVAQFTFYEWLFGLWHFLHLPIFFMMILSALVHVLAVHMY